jgi:hypothetical protein
LVISAGALAQPPSPSDTTSPERRSPLSGEVPAPSEERVIVIARTPGDDGVVLALRAELAGSDWSVVDVEHDERVTPSLGALGESRRARAAVRVDARRGIVELWVLGPDGAVEETLNAAGERRNEPVLALRVVEALRARGLRIEKAAPAEPEVVRPPPEPRPTKPLPPPPPEPRPVSRGTTHVWFDLGPGVALSAGGLEPAAVLEAGLRLELPGSWALGASGVVPLTTASLSGPEGAADVTTWLVAGSLELGWGELSFGGFRSGVGAGAAMTTMSGDAGDGFEGASDTVTTFAAHVRTSFHVHLASWCALRAGASGGLTFPEVTVAFGERSAATWGRPYGVASLALETNVLSW